MRSPAVLLLLALGACGAPAAPPGTVRIPPGEEFPGFFLDREEVTTARFAAFVAETGHETDAERYGWSLVFHAPGTEPPDAQVVAGTPWWVRVDGADWRRPRGRKRRPPRTNTRPRR